MGHAMTAAITDQSNVEDRTDAATAMAPAMSIPSADLVGRAS